MLDPSKFSPRYEVRPLGEEDADSVLKILQGNRIFVECSVNYGGEEPSRERVLADMHAVPEGLPLSKKHYVGMFEGERLAAVLDILDGFPEPDIAFIGLFLMAPEDQGQGEGTRIIGELAAYLKSEGMSAIRLGIDKGNPQSTHFWKKNGFAVIREVERNDGVILVAERRL